MLFFWMKANDQRHQIDQYRGQNDPSTKGKSTPENSFFGSELKKNGYFYMILQFENFHLVPIYW